MHIRLIYMYYIVLLLSAAQQKLIACYDFHCVSLHRNPMYWLGTGPAINMPEDPSQPPHYSIRYGFREGAQDDIFEDTNPRRHRGTQVSTPAEQTCDGKPSRVDTAVSAFELTSPNCECTASFRDGTLRIFHETSRVWIERSVDRLFGPTVVVNEPKYKAGLDYFPNSRGPYRMDLDDLCYLYVTDSHGLVVWESPFSSNEARHRVAGSFRGFDEDPAAWPAVQRYATSSTNLAEGNAAVEDFAAVEDAGYFNDTGQANNLAPSPNPTDTLANSKPAQSLSHSPQHNLFLHTNSSLTIGSGQNTQQHDSSESSANDPMPRTTGTPTNSPRTQSSPDNDLHPNLSPHTTSSPTVHFQKKDSRFPTTEPNELIMTHMPSELPNMTKEASHHGDSYTSTTPTLRPSGLDSDFSPKKQLPTSGSAQASFERLCIVSTVLATVATCLGV